MSKIIYTYLLIFYGIWCQGITETFADEDIHVSSDDLVRQKREGIRVRTHQVPHVVGIKELNRIHCMGNILSHYVVITAASCVWMDPPDYKVVPSSMRTNRGIFHAVTEIKIHLGDHPRSTMHGVGLLIVNPPFVYSQYCQPIQLHTAPLLSGTVGRVTGWGHNIRGENRGIDQQYNLQTIETQIIGHWDCVNRYQQHYQISDKDVCTFHSQRHCGRSDFGAGLVVDGYLAGVFIGSGLVEGQIDPHYPDVFAILQHSEYNRWIRTNVRNIDSVMQRNHH